MHWELTMNSKYETFHCCEYPATQINPQGIFTDVNFNVFCQQISAIVEIIQVLHN